MHPQPFTLALSVQINLAFLEEMHYHGNRRGCGEVGWSCDLEKPVLRMGLFRDIPH